MIRNCSNFFLIMLLHFLCILLKQEHRLYPEVVAALCDDRIFWSDNGVPIIKDNDEMEKYESLEKGLVSVYENPLGHVRALMGILISSSNAKVVGKL